MSSPTIDLDVSGLDFTRKRGCGGLDESEMGPLAAAWTAVAA